MFKIIVLSLALYACATTTPPAPQIITQEVRIPIPTPCNPSLRPEPAYPDTDAALASATNALSATRDLLIGRRMRNDRINEIMAALAACRNPTENHQ